MATLLSDDFNRANSTTVVGSPQIGPAPAVLSGTGGISSNQLYCPVITLLLTYDLATPGVELSSVFNSITAVNGVGYILGVASTTDFYLVYFSTASVVLYQQAPGGLAPLYTSTVQVPAGSGSVCKARYRDGIIRAYVDDVLVFRWKLDAPITATKHGVRISNTSARVDNLLGTDAPTIAEDFSGGLPSNALTIASADASPGPAFIYKGRDTKLQDAAAGA